MSKPYQSPPQALGLRPGELVRVRSVLEIGPTLDAQGSLDGMPFMPEMLQYCGRTFRVSRRADKTCAGDGAMRRMHNAVHLADLRCDGAGHGGCEAACLLFWNEAWLERADDQAPLAPTPASDDDEAKITETLVAATRVELDSHRTAVSLPGHRDPERIDADALPRARSVRQGRAELGTSEDPQRAPGRGVQLLAVVRQATPSSRAPGRRRTSLSVHPWTAAGEERRDALRDARPAAGRAGSDQEQEGDRSHARRGSEQPGAALRRRDGPLLRPYRAGPGAGGAPRR